MPLTLRQLEIFERVAKSEHVTKASEQLLLSQSAVSMAIAELEKFAGAPLFERRGRRLFLIIGVVTYCRKFMIFLKDG